MPVNTSGIFKKINAARVQKRRIVAAILADGLEAAIEATPERTGYLRASWYVAVDGSPTTHPNPPSQAEKETWDQYRIFRRMGGKNAIVATEGPSAGIREGAPEGPDFSPDNPRGAATAIVRAALSGYTDKNASRVFPRQIDMVNSAEYVEMENWFHSVDNLQAVATAAAGSAMQSRAASLRATTARLAL